MASNKQKKVNKKKKKITTKTFRKKILKISDAGGLQLLY